MIVGVNGRPLPTLDNLSQIIEYMKASLERGPVEVLFVEFPSLRDDCMKMEETMKRNMKEVARKARKTPPEHPVDVIELFDDD